MRKFSTMDDARTGPSSASQDSIRYDAGWRSSWTDRARSPMTRLIRRISTPTSRSSWRSESARVVIGRRPGPARELHGAIVRIAGSWPWLTE